MKLSAPLIAQLQASQFVKNLEEGIVQLDNSEFTLWEACRLKGIFGGALKMSPKRNVVALKFGSAVHAGMETHLRGGTLAEQIESAKAKGIAEGLPECGDDRRNMHKLEELFESYALDYKMRVRKFDPVIINDQPAIEVPFSLPLGEFTNPETNSPVQVIWTGKIDLISWWDDHLAIVDHKTTSVMGAQYTATMERSSQFLGYMWAANKLAEAVGHEVREVIVNAIALRSRGFEFQTFSLPFTKWQVEEWRQDVLGTIEDIVVSVQEGISGKNIPATRESCCTKYGKCAFFNVCNNLPQLRHERLADTSEFYKSEWNPLTE